MTSRTPVPTPQSYLDFRALGSVMRSYGVKGPMAFVGDFAGGFEVISFPEYVFSVSLLTPRNDNAPEAA